MRTAAVGALALASTCAFAASIVSFYVPGVNAQVLDVNNRNVVVGTTFTGANTVGFVRAPDGTIQKFSVGSAGTSATAINDRGEVAGMAFGPFGPQAFIRNANGQSYTLFSIPGATSINVTGIDNRGRVVGSYSVASPSLPFGQSQQFGFIRNTDGSILTAQMPGLPTLLTGINDHGDTSGYYIAASVLPPPPPAPGEPPPPPIILQNPYGFVRTAAGLYDLITVGGAPNTVEDINLGRDVAGNVPFGPFGPEPFIRLANGQVAFIDIPKAQFANATGINDARTVAGTYTTATGVSRGFLAYWNSPPAALTAQPLAATPEPASWSMTGIAFAALAALGRRRRTDRGKAR